VAGCSIREEGLRAAALPGRVAAAYSMTLDAGPRAHERVGHVEERVLRFCAAREEILLGREFEPSHGGVARVPQPRQVLEVRAARLPSAHKNVVVQALEPVWTSNFGRPTPSSRRLVDFRAGRNRRLRWWRVVQLPCSLGTHISRFEALPDMPRDLPRVVDQS